MTTMKVLKVFHDVKREVRRELGEEFTDSNDRALELAKLGLVEVLEIEKPKARKSK